MTMELPRVHSGKVRELYDAGEGRLVMVASDRVSAFDVVMAEPITDKGRVLTAMTSFWCDEMADIVPGSQITADPVAMADALGAELPAGWAGRAVLVRRAEMLHLECIVRGYLAGQAYEEYARSGTVHGSPMPAGLQLASQLDEPIFTPSTKATEGHDINIDFAGAVDKVGAEAALAAKQILSRSTPAPRRAAPRPVSCWPTPSLSWATSTGCSACATRCARPIPRGCGRPTRWCRARRPPPSTSSPCRDWLAARDWDRRPPPPPLPTEVTSAMSARYVAAYERVTGRSLDDWYGAKA